MSLKKCILIMGYVYIPSWFNGLTSIFLMALFTAFITLFVILGGMKNYIQYNWEEYRCNPLIIPFAGFFGRKVVQNFNDCLGRTVKKSSPRVLSSWTDNLTSFSVNFDSLRATMSQLEMHSDFDNRLQAIAFGNVMGRLTDVSTTAQLLMMKIKSIFQKVIALYIALLYAAWSIMNGMKGIVKDPTVRKTMKTIEKVR
jgi:hypothetical protein